MRRGGVAQLPVSRSVVPFLHSALSLAFCFGMALQVRERTATPELFVAPGIVFGVMLGS